MSIASVDVTVRGVRSRVLTAGRPDAAEAVVFVHGNPGPADDWRDLLIRAGELGRAIAPDMPGYGQAGEPAGFAYSVDGYAEYLAALLDQLRITRAHIVAHDFGGPWALAWAARHPDALASATLARPAVALRPLDRPALVIWGTKDAYLPYEQAERQRQAFPSAQVELLDGHGHWVMLEDPERVASLVIPFLERQLPDPATAPPASSL